MTEVELTTSVETHPTGTRVLAVAGELDHHTAPRLRATLDEIDFGSRAPVVIDMSAVDYCDSTGITVLVTAYNRTRQAGAPLALAGLSEDLSRIFGIVGLRQLFSCYPTADAAVDDLKS